MANFKTKVEVTDLQWSTPTKLVKISYKSFGHAFLHIKQFITKHNLSYKFSDTAKGTWIMEGVYIHIPADKFDELMPELENIIKEHYQ